VEGEGRRGSITKRDLFAGDDGPQATQGAGGRENIPGPSDMANRVAEEEAFLNDGAPGAKKSRRGGARGDGRSFVARTFSALDGGSLRGSIFALCASAIGSGVLGLPYVCNLCGYVAGPTLMFVAANAANISLRMLIKLAVLGDMKSYTKICTAAGGPALAKLLAYLIVVFMFGSCIGY
jgi:hypothetical protein